MELIPIENLLPLFVGTQERSKKPGEMHRLNMYWFICKFCKEVSKQETFDRYRRSYPEVMYQFAGTVLIGNRSFFPPRNLENVHDKYFLPWKSPRTYATTHSTIESQIGEESSRAQAIERFYKISLERYMSPDDEPWETVRKKLSEKILKAQTPHAAMEVIKKYVATIIPTGFPECFDSVVSAVGCTLTEYHEIFPKLTQFPHYANSRLWRCVQRLQSIHRMLVDIEISNWTESTINALIDALFDFVLILYEVADEKKVHQVMMAAQIIPWEQIPNECKAVLSLLQYFGNHGALKLNHVFGDGSHGPAVHTAIEKGYIFLRGDRSQRLVITPQIATKGNALQQDILMDWMQEAITAYEVLEQSARNQRVASNVPKAYTKYLDYRFDLSNDIVTLAYAYPKEFSPSNRCARLIILQALLFEKAAKIYAARKRIPNAKKMYLRACLLLREYLNDDMETLLDRMLEYMHDKLPEGGRCERLVRLFLYGMEINLGDCYDFLARRAFGSSKKDEFHHAKDAYESACMRTEVPIYKCDAHLRTAQVYCQLAVTSFKQDPRNAQTQDDHCIRAQKHLEYAQKSIHIITDSTIQEEKQQKHLAIRTHLAAFLQSIPETE